MPALVNASGRANKRRKLSPAEDGLTKISKKEHQSHNGLDNQDSRQQNDATMPSGGVSQDIPPVKDLGSSNSTIRRAAFRTILKHLEDRPATLRLSSVQCLQLWKGFFVAIYMHDSKNAISVQNLLKDIASTFTTISLKTGDSSNENMEDDEESWLATYHTAFHETLVREWAGIDSHRMNKYLLLIRFVTRELALISLRPLLENKSQTDQVKLDNKSKKSKSKSKAAQQETASTETAPSATQQQAAIQITNSIIRILSTVGPLNSTDRKIADGLRLHLLDVLPDELFSAINALKEQADSDSAPAATQNGLTPSAVSEIVTLYKVPLEKMAKGDSGAQRHVRLRAKEALQSLDEKLAELET